MSCRSSSSNDTIHADGLEKASPTESTHSCQNEMQEGGLQAWLTLAGAFLMQVSTFGYTLSFGAYQGGLFRLKYTDVAQVMVDYYVRYYLTKYSPTQIGWIGGVQLCLVFSAGIFTGKLFDRGYFRHMMIAGTCLHAFSFFMLSLSQENKWYQVFLSHGVGSGLASGIVYIPCLCIVSHHFKRRRALAMGIVAAGTASGATVHPILLNHLFHTKIGFHNGVRISAGINSVCFILANLMMRTNQASKPSMASNVPLMRLFRDPAYGLMVVSAMLSNFGMFFPQFFIQLNAVLHGIDRNTAFYYLSVMNASSVFGRTLIPLLCPKIGVINVNIVFAFVMSINVLCLWAVNTEIGYILFSISFGFVSGANVALVPPMIASLADSVEEIGARMGIAFASSGIIALFATPIAGALLTVNYNWGRPVLFAGICLISSAALVVIARHFVVKRTGSQLV